jgi:hypothetical protein
MLLPSKQEDLTVSTFVLGAEILSRLKKKDYNIENLFCDIRSDVLLDKKGESESLSLNQFYNTLTFLWVIEAIDSDGFFIRLNK